MNTKLTTSQLQQEQKHTNVNEKVNQRNWILSQIEKPRVLDCFAGDGLMENLCYTGLEYLGIDLNLYKGRNVICVDSRRFLKHNQVDLNYFNIFDLDAFGSAFEHLWIICNRIKPKQKLGFCITQSGVFGKKNNIPPQVLRISECSSHIGASVQNDYILEIYDKFFTECWKKADLVEVSRQRFICEGYMKMIYYSFICEPKNYV